MTLPTFLLRCSVRWLGAAAFASAAWLVAPGEAAAESIIKSPDDHPKYSWELEPHLNLGLFGRGVFHRGRSRGRGNDADWGAGFRATPIIVDPGFIKTLNNTVGITFGVDVASCRYCDAQLFIPVGMQWNFYVAPEWSVFGEVGGLLRTDAVDVWPDLMLQAGGRWHFSESMALTMRAGYPWFSVGVSFFVD